MALDAEVGSLRQSADRPLQTRILEGNDAPTLLADDVMVVDGRVDPLVADGVAAQIDLLDQIEPLQLLQGPVDRAPADSSEAAIDLGCSHRAVLSG